MPALMPRDELLELADAVLCADGPGCPGAWAQIPQ
jgi:hypothetical protein